MKEALAMEELEVICVSEGQEALNLVSKGLRPDIVLSDYRMPGLTGADLIKNIRNSLNQNVPAIVISGDTSAQIVLDENLVDIHVLKKPTSVDSLLDIIRLNSPSNAKSSLN